MKDSDNHAPPTRTPAPIDQASRLERIETEISELKGILQLLSANTARTARLIEQQGEVGLGKL